MLIQFNFVQQCIQISTRINSSNVHTYIRACFIRNYFNSNNSTGRTWYSGTLNLFFGRGRGISVLHAVPLLLTHIFEKYLKLWWYTNYFIGKIFELTFHISVQVSVFLSFTQSDSVNDGRVIQLI